MSVPPAFVREFLTQTASDWLLLCGRFSNSIHAPSLLSSHLPTSGHKPVRPCARHSLQQPLIRRGLPLWALMPPVHWWLSALAASRFRSLRTAKPSATSSCGWTIAPVSRRLRSTPQKMPRWPTLVAKSASKWNYPKPCGSSSTSRNAMPRHGACLIWQIIWYGVPAEQT